uniref:RING-type domain-containing protein n=1 Tax=Periophthalmus magnuspinnatus TaxID=409849 RepID=A0A3B4ADC9_9GOBI
MVLMTHCCCFMCESCFKSWFSSVIREKPVEQFVCPLCGKPDFKNPLDLDMDYFNLLDTQIRHFLAPELHDLFQRKLRDRALVHMKHFCWCSHCSFGVVHESGSLKMDCPSCNKSTCSRCRSPTWIRPGLDPFQTWFRPGLILSLFSECPDCGELFSGSRGGCLHFSCLRCGTQFCGGCSCRAKISAPACGFSVSCSSRGLHAHHPRDCVYHLRDWSMSRLHLLLQVSQMPSLCIKYPPGDARPSGTHSDVSVLQRESHLDRTSQSECRPRPLIRSHYVERLVHLLNTLGADPVVVFSVEELEMELRRWNQPLPLQQTGPALPRPPHPGTVAPPLCVRCPSSLYLFLISGYWVFLLEEENYVYCPTGQHM